MKSRYLPSILIVVLLLATIAPVSRSQSSLPQKGTPATGDEIVESSSLTLDRPLPTAPATVQSGPSSTLMTENFENGFPSPGWTVFDNDGATNGEFYWDDDDYKPHGGSRSAWCARGGADGLDPQSWYYPDDARSWMVYGPVDLSASNSATLNFYYWNLSEQGYDYFSWMASTNGTNFYGTRVSGNSHGWQYVSFDLTNVPTLGDVTGDSSVWIAFIFTSDSGIVDDGAFVDDVSLQASQSSGNNSTVFLPLTLSSQPPTFSFQPIPDGYSFPNYGNDAHYWQDDLGVADLIHMFGAAQVCAWGSTPADCVLTAAAEYWRQQLLYAADGGHCEGMAVTSLRFYGGQTYYTGATTPADFQSGAQRTYDLSLNQAVQNYIMYYFSLQVVDEVYVPREVIRTNYTPSQILGLLQDEMNSGGSDPYTIEFYYYTGGGGHAITPYAVEDRGGGIYWVYVYDNNYPGQALYISFNTNNNTWYYNSNYQGNTSSRNLTLTRLSYRNLEPFSLPWALGTTTVKFFLTGGGDLLIANARGQRIGYDPATGQTVDEIPGAQIVPLVDGLNAMYVLPLQDGDQQYAVTVNGRALTGQVSTNLVMAGPGYVAGFEGIQLQPDQDLHMTVSADGQQLTFEPGQAAPTPQTFRGTDEPGP